MAVRVPGGLWSRQLAVVGCVAIGACGGSNEPDTPLAVSLIASAGSIVREADDRTVEVTVLLDRPAPSALTVPLEFSGTATRDHDYAAGADAVTVPAAAVSAAVEIDVFRDFDPEEDETITVGLGALEGTGAAGGQSPVAGSPSSVTLTVLDGGAASIDVPEPEPEPAADFFPAHYYVTGESVVLGFIVLNGTEDTVSLVAERSTDAGFLADVHTFGVIDVPPFGGLDPFPDPDFGPDPGTGSDGDPGSDPDSDGVYDPDFDADPGAGGDPGPGSDDDSGPDPDSDPGPDSDPDGDTDDDPDSDPDTDFDPFLFLEPLEFTLPLAELAPSGRYYVRVYLLIPGAVPPGPVGPDGPGPGEYLTGFATNASGQVVTTCEAPTRTAGSPGADPLFTEQWHLINTGQTGFSNAAGVAGADLRMTGAIAAGHGGDGVTLAVIDTGLEICHPDLAANVAEGRSFNFGFESSAGASLDDPFNHDLFGDHGTSVAGVAAAVANNGLGGRGVAAEVELVGFNVGAGVSHPGHGGDAELALFRSLGASRRDPDSTGVDIFNMSFGTALPSENASEDFVALVKMGTGELRAGRGALYVKAAGNEFENCYRTHPLNTEIGCLGSNGDPDQNLPWLISVGGFNADDVRSSYSSAGANLWVVGPSGEDGREHPAIITTDQAGVDAGFDLFSRNALTSAHPLNRDGDYVNAFGGTSAAAPAVAGAIAVLLGVNPELTWRDVKHVLAATARRVDPDRPRVRVAFNGRPYIAQHAWQTNAAGYGFHNWYGFGAVAIDAAVALAMSHAPGSLGEFVESPSFGAEPGQPLDIPDEDGGGVTDTLTVTGLSDTANIEAVTLNITVEHDDAWDLGVTITSPAGTESVVNAPFNDILDEIPGIADWNLMSNAFYGENPNGVWRIQVVDLASGDTGRLVSWALRFHYGEHP